MTRTAEEIQNRDKLYYEAEEAILKGIADQRFTPSGIRELAEAYALLTGKLTAKPVTVKNG